MAWDFFITDGVGMLQRTDCLRHAPRVYCCAPDCANRADEDAPLSGATESDTSSQADTDSIYMDANSEVTSHLQHGC